MPRADHLPPEPDVDDVVSVTTVDPGPVPPPPPPEEPAENPRPEVEGEPAAAGDNLPPEVESRLGTPESEAGSDPEAEPGPEPEAASAPPVPAPGPPGPVFEALPAPGLPRRPVRRIPASGEEFGGYTLGESLGHGGFAHVYRATDDAGAPVALKILTGLPDDARRRFAQEAELLESLDGRGFPRFVTADLEAPQPWFAMELVPGSTLLERIQAGGPLPGGAALRMTQQLVDALLVLQEQHCLHRDLKPANIMVDGDRAVLIDLGIAKVFDAATSTQPAGTVTYMAPELFGRRVHPRSDVYSLGLLLVFALAGTLPPDLNFLGRDLEPQDLVEPEPGTEPPELDEDLLPLILAMTRYQPAHRPPLENIARVVRALIEGAAPDPALLLADRLQADGVTRAERAALSATEVLVERPTKVFEKSPGAPAAPGGGAADAPDGLRRAWHGLVYDRELMRVLSEVHGDGFDGAASEVIADHVAELGIDAAEGHTPAEIKDWIWQAMRWEGSSPPDGHADTLRGWRGFRNPEPEPEPEPAPAPAATAVITPAPPSISPRPGAMRRSGAAPRPTSVQRLGPVPRKPSPVVHLGPTPQPPAVRPRSAPPAAAPPAQTAVQQPLPQPAQQPRPVPQPIPQPAPQPVPRGPVAGPPAPRRSLGARVGRGLLRWVPRGLLLVALGVMVLNLGGASAQGVTPFAGVLAEATALPARLARYFEAPVIAALAMVVAMALRSAGHRMRVWFYVLATLALVGGAFILALVAMPAA